MSDMLMQEGTRLVVRVPEELDHHTADEIRERVDYLLKREPIQWLVFDFSKTTFCDSSGIGMLMGRYKMMRALGGFVEAIHVGEPVRRILRMSGVAKLIAIENEVVCGEEIQ